MGLLKGVVMDGRSSGMGLLKGVVMDGRKATREGRGSLSYTRI